MRMIQVVSANSVALQSKNIMRKKLQRSFFAKWDQMLHNAKLLHQPHYCNYKKAYF